MIAEMRPSLSLVASLLLLATLWLPLWGQRTGPSGSVHATQGIADESSVTWGLYSLNGEWQFWPGVLIDPSRVANGQDPSGINLKVPSSWRQNAAIPADTSQGTYHLRLLGLSLGQTYGVYLPEVAGAYRFYVDGSLVAQSGELGDAITPYRPQVGPKSGVFQARAPFADFVVQVVDQTTSRGGLWVSPLVGPSSEIEAYSSQARSSDIFFLAAAWIITVAYFSLSLVLNHRRVSPWGAVLGLLAVVKLAFSQTYLGFDWLPGLSYLDGMKLAYLSVVLLLPVFLSYYRWAFPQDLPRWVVTGGWVFALFESMAVLFSPFFWYESTFLWYQLVLVSGSVVVFRAMVRSVKETREGAIPLLVGLATVVVAGVNDILYSNEWIHTGYWVGAAVPVLLLSQFLVSAQRFRRQIDIAQDLQSGDAPVGWPVRGLERALSIYHKTGIPFVVILVEASTLTEQRPGGSALWARIGAARWLAILPRTRLADERSRLDTLTQSPEADRHVLWVVGAAEVQPDSVTSAEVIQRAEQALERAKKSGWGRVEIQ